MLSRYGPQNAPAGDVGTALMMVDSRLKGIHSGSTGSDPEQQELTRQFTESLSFSALDDVLDGTCTLIYMFMTWLRHAHEEHEKDVIEYVVPNLVASMRMMPKSIRPEAIPTMAGLVIAAGTGLSPNLWRKQYGDWTGAEMQLPGGHRLPPRGAHQPHRRRPDFPPASSPRPFRPRTTISEPPAASTYL